MKTLEKTMTEFVLEFDEPDNLETDEFSGVYYPIYEYAQFLSTPLTLGMFIPCDEDGNVLEQPKPLGHHEEADEYEWDEKEVMSYQKALSNVLFDGFEVCDRNSIMDCLYNKEKDLHLSINDRFYSMTLESLIPYKLKLTDNFKL